MTSHAETVELLVKKANFQPQVALAVAEAIDNSMRDSQLVTVPILDARLADLKTDTQAALLRLENKLDATKESLSKDLVVTTERLSNEFDVKMERLSKEFDVKMERLSKEFAVKMECLSKEFAVKMECLSKEFGVTTERVKAELVRWVVLAMLASTAISTGALAVNHFIH